MPITRSRPASSKSTLKLQAPPRFFRMPAEWERHEATWLTWPTNRVTWPGKMLAEVESIYTQMLHALLPHEKVNLLVQNAGVQKKVLRFLNPKKDRLSNLHFHEVKTVDTWIRDYGPIFIVDQKMRRKAFTKWRFNAWGGKYADLARDNVVVNKIETLRRVPRYEADIIMEGGSIDMNGLGTCLTTEQCLLNPNRNPQLSRKDIERYLGRYLGVKKVIWLKEGIEGDDTDGHVDDITRFTGPRTMVTAVEGNASDKNSSLLEENLQILSRATDHDGKRFRIVELPMPGRVGVGRSDTSHNRLPASYANFYIANGVVLLPIYSHRNDALAAQILKKVFPTRKIVPIECTALVYGLGSIHCVTQQEPAIF